MRQLAQRIVARYHLGALSKPEVAPYVQHRLEVSGTQRQLFPEALMGQLYRLSKGVPRIINVLCDRALLGAYQRVQQDSETPMTPPGTGKSAASTAKTATGTTHAGEPAGKLSNALVWPADVPRRSRK